MNALYSISTVSLGMMLRNRNITLIDLIIDYNFFYTFLPADSYKHFCRNFFIFFNLELSCFSKFVVSAINFAIYLAQFCHSFFKHFIGASLFLTPFIFTKMFFSRFFKYIFASSFLLIFFAKVVTEIF